MEASRSKRKLEFPCYIRTERNDQIRWCFFDSDGRIARTLTRFINHLQDKVPHALGQDSVRTMVSDLKTTIIWMRNLLPKEVGGDIPLDRVVQLIERKQIEQVVKSMTEHGVGAGTVVSRENVIKQILVWCTTQDAGEIRDDHPYSEVEKNIARKGPVAGLGHNIDEYINYEMLVDLLNNFHNESERVFHHFLFDVGPRIAEACDMTFRMLPTLNQAQRAANTLEDYFKLPHEDLYLPAVIKARKKRTAEPPEREVVISLPTIKRILRYHRTKEYMLALKNLKMTIASPERPVFLTATGQKWQVRNANRAFRAAAGRGNLPSWLVGHALRGGAANLILLSEDMGKTYEDRLLEAKNQLGHRWLATLENHYANMSAILLARLEAKAKGRLKWEYLLHLTEDTWLGPKHHTEKRGHGPR